MPDQVDNRDLDMLIGRMKSAAAPFRGTLRDLFERYRELDEGAVADYIPELAKVNPDYFGIVLVTFSGQAFEVGDSRQEFTSQAISRPFMYGVALEQHGREAVLAKVGVEPTGEAFNSIVLDEQTNRPFNPMVNAGAIATADLVQGRDFSERVTRMLTMFSRYCGRTVYIDNSVFISERSTGHRNRAIGHLMLNFGMVGEKIAESLELYFQQCSVLVNCYDLAVMGATRAACGVNPLTGDRDLEQQYVKDVLSVMLTCGMYNYAGEWAYRVGLPAKSGVGGGIVAALPGIGGIACFSPRLDAKGNSVRGLRVFEDLAQRFGLHCFNVGGESSKLLDELSLRGGN